MGYLDIGPQDKTILVTGGAGFIGSHLTDALVAENEVRILDNLSTGKKKHVNSHADFIRGDIRDRNAVRQAMAEVDIVFHQAALVSVEESIQKPGQSHDINASGTLNILEAAREVGARVVAASSAAIYGHPETIPIGESEPKSPSSPYGIDKLSVDHYTRQYNELYDLPTVGLRYFNVYGPRQGESDYAGVISIFGDQAQKGANITVEGDGEQTRDFVHVSDIVQANLLAATTDCVGKAYNVGTGESVKVQTLAEKIIEVVDSKSEIVHTDPRSGDIEKSEANITKIKSELGFSPLTTLQDGLEDMIS